MDWPKIDAREPFDQMEKRLGITQEIDDVRLTSLGAHPSESFYCHKERKIDLARMRSIFDSIAERY